MSAGAAPSGEQLAELCRAALREARRHADEAEALAVHTAAGLTRFANSFIHQNVAEETVSLQLRVLRGGRTATASTTRLDAAGLAELATAAAAAANARPVDPSWPGFAPPEPAPDPGHWDAATADAGPDQRAALVAAFVAAGAGLAAAGYCDTEARTAALCSTTGHEVWGRTTRATIDGIQQGGGVAGSAHATSIRVADLDGAAAGELAAGRARRGLDAADLAPGEYEVVLEPECVATIAVFLGFEAFSAKAVAEGRSGIRLGEAAFDPAFALVDDARAPGSPALAFDAEGVPRRRVELVDGGRAVGLLHDRRTAAAAGAASSGHSSGRDAWGPAPAALFVAPDPGGPADAAGLAERVERGLLVTTFNYCRVLDPKTLVVTGLTRNGVFLIENGRVGPPVSNLRFTQSFLEALGPGRVGGVASAARLADEEFGVGLVTAPAMHLHRWRFTGGAAG